MCTRAPCSCRLLVIVAMLFAAPALAAGVDCYQATDPIAEILCAHPSLLRLDSQLSSAYEGALARNPSHTADMRRDEIAWLGERNRQISWALAEHVKFPSLPNDVVSSIARVYQHRIAFLQNVGNPSATQGLPLARAILAAVPAGATNAGDLLKALRSAGIVMLAKDSHIQSNTPGVLAQPASVTSRVDSAIAAMAASPTAALRTALAKWQTPNSAPYSDVYYLPHVGLGGTYTIEGTADCQYWVLFEKRGNVTVPVRAPMGLLTGGCTRDGGSTGYLALIDGHAVALNVTNDPAFMSTADLQWRRWIGGNQWGPTVDVRFRYAVSYKRGGNEAYCPRAAFECVMPTALGGVQRGALKQPQSIAEIAWNAAQRYIRDPLVWSQVHAADKAGFQNLLDHAPGRTTWADCTYATWFPARLNGQLVIGGISELHLACHPVGPGLTIGIWGRQNGGKGWWFAGSTVSATRGALLSAAVVPPGKNLF